MKKWEEIVKEKFEEPIGALPEDLFAEFCSRVDTAGGSSVNHRKLLWALIPAAASGLAAILFLGKPSMPEDGIQLIQQPAAPVAIITDIDADAGTSTDPDGNIDKGFKQQPKPQNTISSVPVQEESEVQEETDIPGPVAEPEKKDAENPKGNVTEETSKISSPYIPENIDSPRTVAIKVLPAAGAVVGGGLLAALVIPALGSSGIDTGGGQGSNIFDNRPFWETDFVRNPVHDFPFKFGLSTRIPIIDRLAITTGLEYSRYTSRFTYSLSGNKEQVAQYLGIPVRLDWSIAYNKRFNVYVGAGLSGDFCVAASLGGEKVKKDGFRISFIGAGGIQFNPTRRVGIFLEPEVTWTKPQTTRADIERRPDWSRPPVEDYVMATYRTEHAFVFSLATGLRITLGE